MPQLTEGKACVDADACRSDLGLTCQNGTCKCNSTQFWSSTSSTSGICINFYSHNQGSLFNQNLC
jgi:hypothetical protein